MCLCSFFIICLMRARITLVLYIVECSSKHVLNEWINKWTKCIYQSSYLHQPLLRRRDRKISGRKRDRQNSRICKLFRVANQGQSRAVWELWGIECCRNANEKNKGQEGDSINTPPWTCFSSSCFFPFVIPELLHLLQLILSIWPFPYFLPFFTPGTFFLQLIFIGGAGVQPLQVQASPKEGWCRCDEWESHRASSGQ